MTSTPGSTHPTPMRGMDSGDRDGAAASARSAGPASSVLDDTTSTRTATRTRRAALAAASAATVALGLAVHFRGEGAAADPAADALYAVLIYLLVAFIHPRGHSVVIGAVALSFCVAIELFQLTGIPLALNDITPLARLVFGTTFVAADLLSYAAGVVVIASIDHLVRRQVRRRVDY
jgi:hypothetical protein